MTKPKAVASPEKVKLYEQLVATNPAVELKGATMPYTSLNGNMFSVLSKKGVLAMRLPEGPREAFLKKYKSELWEDYGAVMKEYVVVPDALLVKTRELQKYFEISLGYVSSLKPKASTKKKAPSRKR